MTNLEANKEAVRGFYDMAFNQRKPEEAIAKYVGASALRAQKTGFGNDAFVERD